MNDASEMLIGTAVDERYFVEAEVGRGRGGALYRARHMVLQNPVVLKVVHRELIDRGCSLRTLREEAMASARISSPHAVTVADFGLTVDQRPYFAMDLLEGRTLDEILREQAPLSEAHAVALLEQIEDVLSEMHAEGMVHGSVRPDNVFVTKRRARDFVKLLGVGMGTLAAVSEAPSAYTSPEQRVGDPLDPRADVFSLAVTAYEMATGALPFAGVDMLTHRGGPPSVRERNASFSASYADAVARALDDDPAKRFESVAAFIEALTPPQQVVIKGSSTRPVSLRDVQDPERFVETQHAPLDNSLPGGGDLPPAPVLAKMRARVASLKATDASKRQQIVLSPDGAPSGLTAREIDDDAKTGQHVPFTGEIPIDDAHPAVEAERAAERVQSAIAQSLDDSGVQAELDASEMPTARPRDPARMAKPVEVTVKSPPPDAMGGEAPKRSGSIDVGDVSSRGFGPADAEAVATLRNVPSVQINTDELDAAAESAARDAERAPQDAQQDGAAVQEGSADDPGATQPLLEGVRPGSKPLAAITLARVSADKAKRGEEDAPRPEAMTLKEAPSVLPPGSKTLISTPLSREDAARLRQAQAQALQPTVSQVEVDAHADANVPADDELDIDPGIAVPAPLPLAEVDNMDELDALEASELADDDDTALGPYAGPLDRPFDNTAPVAADPAAGGMS
ncbi:MAG: serine/threonine protein kinase, partial [Myxococcales bacterium]|nr:serine/threonine protein kinase [Myxococcales bacterium]